MPIKWDPEFREAVAPIFAARANEPKPDAPDPLAVRAAVTAAFETMLSQLPRATEVEHSEHRVPSYDGETIPVHRFWKKETETTTPAPALIHLHGGGMIFGSGDMFHNSCALTVQETGVQIFTVDYRLAPEHRFPTPVEDCYAALAWVHKNAEQFGIDRQRIGALGGSAGANLAAAITLMARDRGLSPGVAKQILVYPMLDDTNTVARPVRDAAAIWTTTTNAMAWSTYLGDLYGSDHVSPYAAPARVVSVEGLPPTYLEIGTADIFLEETLKFASRLAAADIEVELHVHPGLPHGFEIYAPFIGATQRAMANRYRAMSTM
ncbi:hypothetical protein N7510_006337 [Penicillium lagena]|uniref:uncharacterized protein n=1 Tax=Penicillium lagena TaxID=94218 RepID=UPI00253FE8A1|nr:uncharacterized protein N7510_006337 [Penicillium lagena]KAJ5613143.1 hypothetical protein N7510_006337 [Penicillium lagena]